MTAPVIGSESESTASSVLLALLRHIPSKVDEGKRKVGPDLREL
jgi:hypothetical protein